MVAKTDFGAVTKSHNIKENTKYQLAVYCSTVLLQLYIFENVLNCYFIESKI